MLWVNGEASPSVISASGAFAAPFTYAGFAPSSSDSNSYFSYSIPPTKLAPGENVIAIELHQTSISSGDAILDCELLATYPVPLELYLESLGNQPLLYWFDPTAVLESSPNLIDWTSTSLTSPLPLQTTGGREFFRLKN